MNEKLVRSLLITCVISGCLEIYDFTVFGLLANELHRSYLGFLDSKTGLVMTYLLFAVGFVFRPIGALVFGYIGDTYGRRIALVSSISLMGVASLGMALLPPYEQIGISACYALVVLRIIQGISVGGEYSGSVIFAIEHSDQRKSGFIGSMVAAGGMLGVLSANLVATVVKMPGLPSFSWRFAFLIGFFAAFMGFVIRRRFSETPAFEEMVKERNSRVEDGFWRKFYDHKMQCIGTAAIAFATGLNVYFIGVYLPRFLHDGGMNISWLYVAMPTLMAVFIPVFGVCSDVLGRAKMLKFAAVGLAIMILPIMSIIYSMSSFTMILLALAVYCLFTAMLVGTMNTFVIEIFKPEVRYILTAFSYSVGMGFGGGTAPIIASMLNQISENDPKYISCYIFVVMLLGLISVCFVERAAASPSTSNILNVDIKLMESK